MANAGGAYQNFLMEQKMMEIPVPTEDIDVIKYLRKLKQPICLFGEDPKERKNRLRNYLAKGMAININTQENELKTIQKIEQGSEKVSELKRFLINFSVPRSLERKKNEEIINQQRINRTNQIGNEYKDFISTASDHSDKRALSALSSHGSMFVVGSLSGAVNVWDYTTYNMVNNLSGHNNRITGCTFLDNDLIATSSIDKTVRLWRSDGTQSIIEFDSPVTSLASHPSQRILVAGLSNGFISVVDVNESSEILRMKSNDGTIGAICCHNDGGLVFSGGSDTVGKLWDLRSCQALKTMIGHSGRITCSTFNDNYHCITGSVDNTAIIWDLRNLSRSKMVAAHTAAVSSVSVKGDILLTSSLDSTLKIWSLLDFRTYTTLYDNPSIILKSCFNDDGKEIITASKDGLWRIFTKPLF